MILNVFFADTQVLINGQPYPESWTTAYQNEVVGENEEVTREEVVILSGLFADYPKRPDPVGTYRSRTVWYIAMDDVQEAAQLRLLKHNRLYLCASYEQMALIDPDLYQGVMECYDAEGNRIKLKDYTGDVSQITIYAPVKIAGVEVQDRPADPEEQFPTMIDRMSQAELYLRQMKEAVKAKAIAFIKANPECSLDDLMQSLTGADSAMLTVMLPYYIQGAAQAGIIPEATFAAFRDFVAATPEDELVAI